MDRYRDEFNVMSQAAAQKQRAENFADLNHEIASVDTGRNHRFLSSEQSERDEKDKDKAHRRLQTMLDLMLLDPEYAAAYQSADQALRDAEQDAVSQIELAEQALKEAIAELGEVTNRAAQLPDGTRVYFDPTTGLVMTEGGSVLTETESAQLEFNGHEPTYSDYLDAKRKTETSQERLNSWYEHQVVLGGYRNEMSDADNPPSIERLGEIEQEIREQRPSAPSIAPETIAAEQIDSTVSPSVELPPIGISGQRN